MNYQTKIKRFILAGILALTLLLGTLNVAGRVHASNSSMQIANKLGTCWKCS
jgi:hypothetical protein